MTKTTITKANKHQYRINIRINKSMNQSHVSIDKDFLEVFKCFPGLKFDLETDFLTIRLKINGDKK